MLGTKYALWRIATSELQPKTQEGQGSGALFAVSKAAKESLCVAVPILEVAHRHGREVREVDPRNWESFRGVVAGMVRMGRVGKRCGGRWWEAATFPVRIAGGMHVRHEIGESVMDEPPCEEEQRRRGAQGKVGWVGVVTPKPRQFAVSGRQLDRVNHSPVNDIRVFPVGTRQADAHKLADIVRRAGVTIWDQIRVHAVRETTCGENAGLGLVTDGVWVVRVGWGH